MPSPVTTISEIGKHDGQTVTIRGWLYNLRESGKLLFPQFRDGSGIIQGVVPKNAVTPEVFEAVKTLTQESSVVVEGKVRADKRATFRCSAGVVRPPRKICALPTAFHFSAARRTETETPSLCAPTATPTTSTRARIAASITTGGNSRADAPEGRVSLSASAEHLIEIATSAVLVLPRGARLEFGAAPHHHSAV